MAVAAVVWLGYESWRLLLQGGYWGAIDLRIYHRLVEQWFAGTPVYRNIGSAIHPPATYLLLWPLLGWLPVQAARWFWAATAAAALAWLIFGILRAAAFQSDSVLTLIRGWLANPGLELQLGESNIHVWLTDLGLKEWRFPVAGS